MDSTKNINSPPSTNIHLSLAIIYMAIMTSTTATTTTTPTTSVRATIPTTIPHNTNTQNQHQQPTHLHYFSQIPYTNSKGAIIDHMLQNGLITACGKAFRLPDDTTEVKTNNRIAEIVSERNNSRLAELLNMTIIRDKDIIFVGPTTYNRFGKISPYFHKIVLTKSQAVLVMNKGSVLLLPKFLGTFVNSLTVIAFALLCAVFVAAVVWVIETVFGTGHFPSSPGSGLWSSFWFIIVTMTTVGYGDKTPKHSLSRLIVMGWLLFGLMLVALVTASAWNAINAEVNVRYKDVAGLENSAEIRLVSKNLLANPIAYSDYPSIFEAVRSNNSIKAAVVDKYIAAEFVNPNDEDKDMVIERFVGADYEVVLYVYYNDSVLGCQPHEIGTILQERIEEEKLRLVELKTKPIQIDPYVLRTIFDIFDGTDNGLMMYMTIGAAIILVLAAVGELLHRFTCCKGKVEEGDRRSKKERKRYKELRSLIEKFVQEEVEFELKKRTNKKQAF